MKKPEREKLKNIARTLYSEGDTYKEISSKLGGINKSTISGWCSDLAKARLAVNKSETKARKLADDANRKRVQEEREATRSMGEYPFHEYVLYMKHDCDDGRVRVHLVDNKPDSRRDRFMLLSRYKMAVKEGRILDRNEEVDHIDGDFSNDCIDNLQILSTDEHRKKTLSDAGHSSRKQFTCVICDATFIHHRKKATCSPSCKSKLQSSSMKKRGC